MTDEEEHIFQKLHELGVAGQRPEKLFLKKKDEELRVSLRLVEKLLAEVWLTLYPEEKPKEMNSWRE